MEAWGSHNDSYGRTDISLDCTDGKVSCVSYSTGSGALHQAHTILLGSISQNTVANSSWRWDDILTQEESQQASKLVEEGKASGMEDAIQKMGISLHERLGEYFFEEIELDWSDIEEQIEELYICKSPEEPEGAKRSS
jgi:hypothetical protein